MKHAHALVVIIQSFDIVFSYTCLVALQALLVDTFTKLGLAVYARDMYGHGFSEGTRFCIPDWIEMRDDAINFCKLVADENSNDIPLFLSGESLGGCITILMSRYFQDHPDEAPINLDSNLLICPAILGTT